MVTETPEVAAALEAAARRWPEASRRRGQLVLRLIQEGHRAVVAAEDEEATARENAVRRTAGALTGVYGQGYLEELRRDWPA